MPLSPADCRFYHIWSFTAPCLTAFQDHFLPALPLAASCSVSTHVNSGIGQNMKSGQDERTGLKSDVVSVRVTHCIPVPCLNNYFNVIRWLPDHQIFEVWNAWIWNCECNAISNHLIHWKATTKEQLFHQLFTGAHECPHQAHSLFGWAAFHKWVIFKIIFSFACCLFPVNHVVWHSVHWGDRRKTWRQCWQRPSLRGNTKSI